MQLFWYERLQLWQIHWKVRFWSAYCLLPWNHATVWVEPSLPDQHACWTACTATLSLNFNFAHIFMPSKLLEMNAVTFSSVSSAYPLHYSGMETMQAVQSSVSVERQPGLWLHLTTIFWPAGKFFLWSPHFVLKPVTGTSTGVDDLFMWHATPPMRYACPQDHYLHWGGKVSEDFCPDITVTADCFFVFF